MWHIPISDIDFSDEELQSVISVLNSKWLSMGPITEQLEEAFRKYLHVKHAFCVSNGTAALHIAHKAIGIDKGDEVITPSLTFVATSNSILYCGGIPVFADVTSIDNFNISVDSIFEKITKNTKALTIVHYGGFPCEMDKIKKIAKDYNLFLIEDAAHAIGAEYKGEKCGTFGDIGCFSFFANKNLVTGEGGLIVTNNDFFAEKIKKIRSHGMTTLTWDRHRGHAHSYDVVDLGYNYRITEISSALGLVQLKKLDNHNRKREEIVKRYRFLLESIPSLKIPFSRYFGKPSHHLFPILLSHNNIPRNKLIDLLKEKGIQVSVHYPPIHLFSYYKKFFNNVSFNLPITEYIGDNEISLPLYPGLTNEQIEYITESIENILVT